VTDKAGCFHFVVESTGVLRPEQLVERALSVLRHKLMDIRTNLDAIGAPR
jgi:hypothetical protein